MQAGVDCIDALDRLYPERYALAHMNGYIIVVHHHSHRLTVIVKFAHGYIIAHPNIGWEEKKVFYSYQ